MKNTPMYRVLYHSKPELLREALKPERLKLLAKPEMVKTLIKVDKAIKRFRFNPQEVEEFAKNYRKI